METTRKGGCACGAVRYELNSEPFDTGWCHCRICQLVSGAPAMAFATVTVGDMVFIAGADAIGTVRLTAFGRRRFCKKCGTPLTIEVEYQPETIDFPVATLDDPDSVAPGFHIFRASKIAWFETADDLPRHERFRPGTRGLEGTEPPDTNPSPRT
jgi:hypothetical protein